MSVQAYKWLRAPVREGVDQGAFSYVYPYGDNSDPWKVRELQLVKGLMRHEFAQFQVISPTGDDWPRWDPYTPIRIDYGNAAGNSTSFHGYVWRPDSEINQQVREPLSQRAMTFSALGSSYTMKEGFAQVFINQTASNIAQAVATNFKFDTNINNTTYIWDQLSSSGDSYFSFMVDLALRSGDFFFTDNTTLYFIEPLGLAKQQTQIPAYYSKDAVFPNPKVYNTPSVINFEADLSEMNEEPGRAKANWNLGSVDLSTGSVITATNDGTKTFGTLVTGGKYGDKTAGRYNLPVFDRYGAKPHGNHPALIANTQGDAASKIATRAANNRFPIRASAELFGNVNLLPGQVLSLHGLGSRNSGKWLIKSLIHRVVWKNWYSTEVELMRDSDFDPNPGGVQPSLIAPVKVIPTTLVGGVWRAQYGVKQPTNVTTSVADIPALAPSTPSTTSGNGIVVKQSGSITNMNQFSSALIGALGILTVNITQVNMITAWQQQEGMWGYATTDPRYAGNMCNPLNLNPNIPAGQNGTYQGFACTGLGGTISFNGNWTAGVQATANTLKQVEPSIAQALKNSDTSLFFSMNGVETWNPPSGGDQPPYYYALIQTIYNGLPS